MSDGLNYRLLVDPVRSPGGMKVVMITPREGLPSFEVYLVAPNDDVGGDGLGIGFSQVSEKAAIEDALKTLAYLGLAIGKARP